MAIYDATLDNLVRINDQVVDSAKKAGLTEQAIYDVEVAVDEACTNIIEHSYHGKSKGEIEVTCQVIPIGLKIIIHDSGCYFTPDSSPKPDINSPLTKRKERGLGLYFMQKLMDEVIFDPCEGEGTILTMVKRRE